MSTDDDKSTTFWGRFWGTVILAVGILLLFQTLEIVAWELWEFVGPLILIIWGIAILRKPESFVWCCCFPYRTRAEKE